MTAASAPPPPPPDGRETVGTRPSGRSTALLVAAALLVVVVVGAVIAFGVERPPPVAPLSDDAPFVPTASLAWSEWNDGEQCLRVGEPDGEIRELRCDERGQDLVGWNDDGILLRAWSDGEEQLVAIDPTTGERTSTDARAGDVHEPGARPWTERDDGQLVVTLDGPSVTGDDPATGDEVWRVDAPASYEVLQSVVSPDGRQVALTDSADRLLVVPADGSHAPRHWSDDVEGYANLVWEGTEPAR